MTEREKMLAGKLYDPADAKLSKLRVTAHVLSQRYNLVPETNAKKRAKILQKLCPDHGENFFLQGPVQFDYGAFTKFGKNFYANFNFTVLDCCPVTIGNDVFVGPNCSLMTPVHALLPEDRNVRFRPDGSAYDLEYAKPIVIKDNCWLASNVTVTGGVTIGEGCVIGAGSVVTRDIPPYSFAAGVPCRVIRKITKDDAIALKKELF